MGGVVSGSLKWLHAPSQFELAALIDVNVRGQMESSPDSKDSDYRFKDDVLGSVGLMLSLRRHFHFF